MAARFENVVDQVPGTIAHFMAGKVKRKWEKAHKRYPEIPATKTSSAKKRRRSASRGKDTVLFDEGETLRATQTVDLGQREVALTNTDRKAVALFFGVPSRNLPARDIFKAVIEEEIAEDRDMKIIGKMLDKFEAQWERQR